MDLDRSALGPTPRLVSDQVKRFCGLQLPEDNLPVVKLESYYDECIGAREKIRRDCAEPDADIQFISYLSGYFHELRHAHDLLSTTYGQDLFFNRLNLYQNVPFMLSKAADFLEEYPDSKIGLPVLSDKKFMEFASPHIVEITSRSQKLSENLAAFNIPKIASNQRISVRDLLEASAVGVQLDFVFDMFGQDALDKLYSFIARSSGSDTYLRLIDDFTKQLSAAGFRGYGGGAAHGQVIWYALNGSTSPGHLVQDGLSCVVLYEALVENLVRSCDRKSRDISVYEWVDQCCSEFFDDWGLYQAKEMVDRTAVRLSERAERVKLKYQEGGGSLKKHPGPEVLKYTSETYEKLTAGILTSGSNFFSQREYVAHTIAGLYPAVVFKVKSNQSVHDFLSLGYSGLGFDLLNEVNIMSMLFDILLSGRHASGSPALEEMYFRSLLNEGWGGRELNFQDRSSVFDW